MIKDLDASAAVLAGLKELGIQLSVDDFGTGYSCLAYLRRFPMDVLKLDKSFVRQEQQQDQENRQAAFVEAFVTMAHTLGLEVVAEGVETEATAQFLRAAGCDEAQGFLYSRPLPLPELERFLSGLPAGRLRGREPGLV